MVDIFGLAAIGAAGIAAASSFPLRYLEVDVVEALAQSSSIACRAVLGKTLFTPAHDAVGKPVRGVATFEATTVVERH